jgi:hypothetical protein
MKVELCPNNMGLKLTCYWEHLGELEYLFLWSFFGPFLVSSSFQSLFIKKLIAFGCETKVDERLSKYGKR